MTDEVESAYEAGKRAAWLGILGECLRNLGYDTPETRVAAWVSEREAAITSLRKLCADFGDNDWDEKLHLADIITKHLGDHLDAEEGAPNGTSEEG